jgi:hypothetical protein
VRTHPVDKLLEQHCYKSAAGLLQLVRFYACRGHTEIFNLAETCSIRDSPYYVFVALCIVAIVVSLLKIAASNENIECFHEYFAVAIAHLTLAFFKSSCTGQNKK